MSTWFNHIKSRNHSPRINIHKKSAKCRQDSNSVACWIWILKNKEYVANQCYICTRNLPTEGDLGTVIDKACRNSLKVQRHIFLCLNQPNSEIHAQDQRNMRHKFLLHFQSSLSWCSFTSVVPLLFWRLHLGIPNIHFRAFFSTLNSPITEGNIFWNILGHK